MCMECGGGAPLDAGMDRRRFLKLGAAGLAGAALLTNPAAVVLARSGPSLAEEFQKASAEYGVPAELLSAMGYVNTLWEMPPPTASPYEEGELEGRGQYGIMQLTQNPSRDTLGRASELTDISEVEMKKDRASNVLGGAALLADLADGSRPASINGWQEIVAKYADSELYAQDVYEKLEEGEQMTISTGETITLRAQDVDVPRVYTAMAAADYPPATWRGAYGGNYTNSRRERTYDIHRIVVHVVQGSASAAISWFNDSRAQVSAHYVVGRGGGVAQCVRNADVAWHSGNWNWNTHSIGIEHAGYGSNPRTWTRKMYHGSARLAAYTCKKHRIPIDGRRIVGHRNVPGGTSSCPGSYFKMPTYIKLVRDYRRRLG